MAINELHSRKSTEQLWERAVDHPFVRELTLGKLAHDKFRDYIVQDKMLCESIRGFVCRILADCSNADEFEGAHKLVAEMQGYGHEAQLFSEMFQAMGIANPEMMPNPTTEAFMDFLWKVGTSGTLEEKLIVLYGIEACYMEWSERAHKRGEKPSDHAYAKWMEIHSAKNLAKVIDWIRTKLDLLANPLTDHHHKLFQRVLQHEIMFWDSAFYPGRRVMFPNDSHEKDLWTKAVEHPFIVEMCNDSLSMERFKDTLTQMKLISDVGLRGLLCDTLGHLDPHHSSTKHVLQMLQALHPGGKHFENMNELLRQVGVADPEHVFVLPATEAVCDGMHKIGQVGNLHEKILILVTMAQLCHARLEWMKKNKRPSNPIFAKFFTHHHETIMEHGMDWMHVALDEAITCDVSGTSQMRSSGAKTVGKANHHPTEHDMHVFKRCLQKLILMNDSCMNRGMWEWPLSHHYHVEGPGRVGGA